jgi:hypothetical protein
MLHFGKGPHLKRALSGIATVFFRFLLLFSDDTSDSDMDESDLFAELFAPSDVPEEKTV